MDDSVEFNFTVPGKTNFDLILVFTKPHDINWLFTPPTPKQ